MKQKAEFKELTDFEWGNFVAECSFKRDGIILDPRTAAIERYLPEKKPQHSRAALFFDKLINFLKKEPVVVKEGKLRIELAKTDV